MIETFDLFATRFFTYKITDDELLQNIYLEVHQKKDQIKAISWATQNQSTEVYATDSSNPIEIHNFNLAMGLLIRELNKEGFSFNADGYWTSLYKNNAIHPLHNHSINVLEKNNYSGILYLTNNGNTEFFSNNPSSFDSRIPINSDAGRFILFPSTIPHQVITNLESDEERCVIAFNGILRQL